MNFNEYKICKRCGYKLQDDQNECPQCGEKYIFNKNYIADKQEYEKELIENKTYETNDYVYKLQNEECILIDMKSKPQNVINIPEKIDNKNVIGFSRDFFYKYKKICTEIKLPNTIKMFNHRIFSTMLNLEKINIPLLLEEIPPNAFLWCMSLEEIIIPPNVKYIGREAFYNCKNLKRVIILNDNIKIEKDSFFQSSNMVTTKLEYPIRKLDGSPDYRYKPQYKKVIGSEKINNLELIGNYKSNTQIYAETYGFNFGVLQ